MKSKFKKNPLPVILVAVIIILIIGACVLLLSGGSKKLTATMPEPEKVSVFQLTDGSSLLFHGNESTLIVTSETVCGQLSNRIDYILDGRELSNMVIAGYPEDLTGIDSVISANTKIYAPTSQKDELKELANVTKVKSGSSFVCSNMLFNAVKSSSDSMNLVLRHGKEVLVYSSKKVNPSIKEGEICIYAYMPTSDFLGSSFDTYYLCYPGEIGDSLTLAKRAEDFFYVNSLECPKFGQASGNAEDFFLYDYVH